MNQIISFDNEYAFLSNFYPCTVNAYKSAEAAYQAQKCENPADREQFTAMLSLVKDKYAHYQEDDLADYVFYQHLQDHGVHVKKTAEVDFSPLQPSKGKGSSAPKAPKKQTEEQKK